jgi:nucleoside-diphosphate-sugar epimerase
VHTPFVVVRSSNMVGPVAPFTGAGKFLQWLEKELDRALNPSKVVELFADEVRSFAHVHDVCAALLALVRLWEAHALVNGAEGGGAEGGVNGGTAELGGEGGGDDARRVADGSSERGRAVVAGWRRGGGAYNMGGPEGLSRVGLAEALAAARPVGTPGFLHGALPRAACSLALADGSPGVAPSSRQALDGKLGYASPLDITMDSSALAAVTGIAFRPMRQALAHATPAAPAAPAGDEAAPPPPPGALRPLSFADALVLTALLALVAAKLMAGSLPSAGA